MWEKTFIGKKPEHTSVPVEIVKYKDRLMFMPKDSDIRIEFDFDGNINFYRVKNNEMQKAEIYKSELNNKLYFCLNCYFNGEYKKHFLHTILSKCFISNKDKRRYVEFKDGNTLNYRLDNLRFKFNYKECRLENKDITSIKECEHKVYKSNLLKVENNVDSFENKKVLLDYNSSPEEANKMKTKTNFEIETKNCKYIINVEGKIEKMSIVRIE